MTFTPINLLNNTEYSVLNNAASSLLDTAMVDHVCRDSRTAHKGSVFICIKGANFDGHDYAKSAYMNGCRVFVSEKKLGLPDDALQITVTDSRIALANISAEFFGHPATELKIVGITGTKGKTTTAMTAYHLLNLSGVKAGYIGSNGVWFDGRYFNTVNTTPESYDLHRYMRLMADCGVKLLVMEVSSQAIYMNRIHRIEFNTAVYTNLSPDHIGGSEHPTFEHYRDSKKRLFDEFHPKYIIYNKDDSNSEYMIKDSSALKISCSITQDADIRAIGLTKAKYDGFNRFIGTEFSFVNSNKYFATKVQSPGEFSVYNALLAAAICRTAGVDLSQTAKKLPLVSIKGRFESVNALPYATFIIDYAHNGVSLTSALKALREYTDGRLICLFGSVGGRTKTRRKDLGDAASQFADLSIITSDNPDFEPPEEIIADIEASFISKGLLRGTHYVTIPDRRDAIRYAVKEARPGDIILLAGKGHEEYQLICGSNVPFSERAVITEAAQEMKDPV